MIELALLGTGGMVPLPDRFLTSLYCRINGRFVLIDCGEGTQISLKTLGWGIKNLDLICFTHFHADHISGLPGLLLTLGNSGRTRPLYMIGPNGLENIVKNLCVIASEIPFEIKIIEQSYLKNNFFKFSWQDYYINILPVEHSIDCLAYNICLPRKRKFNPDQAIKLGIPKKFWSDIQNEKKIIYKKKIFIPEMVLGPGRKGIKISYCTDARPSDNLINFVSESDLFICEGIYGDDEKLDKAIIKKHMVFSEAAHIAKKACVKELWLTHFSPAMPDPEKYLDSAKNIFENTIVAHDRITKIILYHD